MRFLLIMSFVLLSCSCAGKHQPNTAASIDEAAVPMPRVHFPTGSTVMVKKDMPRLAGNIRWMMENPDEVIILEGHCDERGGDAFNLELGDRRARSIKALIMREGVNEEKMIMIVSRGKREPIDPRHDPKAWKMNRRVEFILR